MSKRGQQNAREPQKEKRKLDELLAHPLQGVYFDDLSEADLQMLAENISENGLRNLLEILPKNAAHYPPNTIVSGHQRRRALLMLGHDEADVLVRYDLAEASSDEIEKAFLSDNLARRQLDTLAKARSALRLLEIEKGRARGDLSRHDQAEARDRVGASIGVSGRSLSRHWRVLATPREVQDAHRRGELSMIVAEKVADLDDETQAAIVERMRLGEPAKAVVKEYVEVRRRSEANVNTAFTRFLRALYAATRDIGGRESELLSHIVAPHKELLRRGARLSSDLLKRLGRER
jgi:hypothetical protein